MTINPHFVELSEALTGVAGLSADLSREYEARLRAEGMGAALDRLLAAYVSLKAQGRLDSDSLEAHLFDDADLRDVAEQLILLWYSSAIIGAPPVPNARPLLKFGKPEHHFRALMWDVIGAHPPALSGGYFGHWHYPPEN